MVQQLWTLVEHGLDLTEVGPATPLNHVAREGEWATRKTNQGDLVIQGLTNL
ncbi:MAG: hypothetical protein JW384_02066 [Nitrosomonadaceae bacterium]|nr:hypothetical protein [Nitrosomonadaceae bacterium]